jgi:hypothetical protein
MIVFFVSLNLQLIIKFFSWREICRPAPRTLYVAANSKRSLTNTKPKTFTRLLPFKRHISSPQGQKGQPEIY